VIFGPEEWEDEQDRGPNRLEKDPRTNKVLAILRRVLDQKRQTLEKERDQNKKKTDQTDFVIESTWSDSSTRRKKQAVQVLRGDSGGSALQTKTSDAVELPGQSA